MLFTGPLAGYLVRHREARSATAAPPAPEPSAPPTIVRRPQASQMPRIVRLKEDSTTVLAAPATEEFSAPTAALRIKRPEPAPDTTARNPAPPNDDATKAP
jgi:hypothetical protein